jgi:hypothetical protein
LFLNDAGLKKILILYPHFPPSNLAGVHRPRLFANHLPAFGWEPTILTVHERFYEEVPDWNLVKLLPAGLRIEKVEAFAATKPRLVGDIGLRGFLQLYRRAKQLIEKEQFDFLYIPIPSFYCALLGRWLHSSTGIRYGIDYIDPWVHQFPGSEKRFSRHWLSTKIAGWLEPVAVKKASLITGVAEGYYKEVLDRNPHLKSTAVIGAMPYGGEERDHALSASLGIQPYLFHKTPGKLQLLYAGAILPKAYGLLTAIFKAIQKNEAAFAEVEFHFIGTGSNSVDPTSFTVKPFAQRYGLWEKSVFEYAQRIPYLDVLAHLNIADGVFILGSTEAHYTPSKTYQAVLSKKGILAVLHERSTAVDIIHKSGSGIVLSFGDHHAHIIVEETFVQVFREYKTWLANFKAHNVDRSVFDQYSAECVTGQLAALLNNAVTTQTKYVGKKINP